MPSHTSQLGLYGEQAAVAHLREHGYTIHETNWHCRTGEIDIIAQQDDMLVFVEVKTRRTSGTALAAITPTKRDRIISAVYAYLDAQELDDAAWRIDAISVIIKSHEAPMIQHVEDALDW